MPDGLPGRKAEWRSVLGFTIYILNHDSAKNSPGPPNQMKSGGFPNK